MKRSRHEQERERAQISSTPVVSLLVTLLLMLDAKRTAQAFSMTPPTCGSPPQATSWSRQRLRTCGFVLFDTETSATPDIDLSHLSSSSSTNQQESTTQHSSPADDDDPFVSFSLLAEEDAPRPTANGGYTHTTQSKAKISAANKGKTPWNKGKKRSDEVRARIAAGVRARNRQRFLQELADMGLTEEEYQQQQEQEKRAKQAEREARRTEKGGYRPSEETKQKISQILKEKHARGEIKPRKVDPSKVRRGFTHSPETRAKIAASMRKRWATDASYRAKMVEKSTEVNGMDVVRQKISDTLRQKWQDPEFRAHMMEKMATRKSPFGGTHKQEHREKISAAIKAKWKDSQYRRNILESIARRKGALLKEKPPAHPKKGAKSKPTSPSAVAGNTDSPVKEKAAKATSISPIEPRKSPRKKAVARRRKKNAKANTAAKKVQPVAPKKLTPSKKAKEKRSVTGVTSSAKDLGLDASEMINGASSSKNVVVNGTDKESDNKRPKSGSVSRLREERRDLYDLLYGDEDDWQGPLASALALGDENLDNFDPYGLDDF